jgi:hypothetical protein
MADIKTFLTPEEVFRLHPRIRWAAFSRDSGEVVFSHMREGVESHTSEVDDRAFMELGALIMSSAAEKLTPSQRAGELESIVVNLEKDSVMLMKVRNGHLAISADKADASEVFLKVTPIIRERYAGSKG